jgi:hypothetical protein
MNPQHLPHMRLSSLRKYETFIIPFIKFNLMAFCDFSLPSRDISMILSFKMPIHFVARHLIKLLQFIFIIAFKVALFYANSSLLYRFDDANHLMIGRFANRANQL